MCGGNHSHWSKYTPFVDQKTMCGTQFRYNFFWVGVDEWTPGPFPTWCIGGKDGLLVQYACDDELELMV